MSPAIPEAQKAGIATGALGELGKQASDLVGDITVKQEGKTVTYTGEVKKITGWTSAFPAGEADGHFLPILLPSETIGQKLTLKGRKGGDRDITVDPDRILVQRLENLSGSQLKIEKDGAEYLNIDVSGLTQQ